MPVTASLLPKGFDVHQDRKHAQASLSRKIDSSTSDHSASSECGYKDPAYEHGILGCCLMGVSTASGDVVSRTADHRIANAS